MNVVVFGASEMIGTRILNELLNLGHLVKAVLCDPSELAPQTNLVVVKGDIQDPGDVAAAAMGADCVISAYEPSDQDPEKLLSATHCLINGVSKVDAERLIVVGSAGTLEVAPGLQLVDTPDFPPASRALALAHREALEILKKSEVGWTCICPPAIIEPGARTGHIRTGLDQLLSNDKGESRISAEDFAVAVVNELETPKHIHRRFTVLN